MNRLPEHLHRDAKARTTDADKRARTALAQIVRTGQAVSFTAVAREAGVSTDFLYKHPQLRSMIERHRAKHGQVPGVRQADTEVLSQQQQAHREEVTQLRKALEVAHGENLGLRRRLAVFDAD